MKINLLKEKPMYHFDISQGAFVVDIYFNAKDNKRCYAEIKTLSGNFSIRLTDYSYMYLMACAKDNNIDTIHGFCTIMYTISSLIFTEQGFVDDIIRSINKYSKRLEKRAEKKANGLSKEALDAEEINMIGVRQWKEDMKDL